MARALQSLGHEVGVACMVEEDSRGRHDAPLGVPALALSRHWPRGLRTLGERLDGRRLATKARRVFGTPDCIWERYSLRCDGGVRLARRWGIPHLLEVNAPLSLERQPDPNETWVLRNTDRVLAVSPWVAKWARVQGARAVQWLPNGSDLQPGKRDLTRAELGLRGLVLVHHGSLRPWHGVARLPAVLEATGATLLLIGDGPGLAHPAVRALPAAGPERLADLLSASDVAVLPYGRSAPPWFDPLKLHDAKAVGLPTVGTRHPACAAADVQVQAHDVQGWAVGIHEASLRPRIPISRPWSQVCTEALSMSDRLSDP